MKKNMLPYVVAAGLAGTTFRSFGGPALEALSGDRLTRYPNFATIPAKPAPNRFTRNVVVGTTAARGNGQDAVFCGNVGFNASPAPERLAALKFLDPLPPESAIGPRADDPFLKRARAVFNGIR